MADLVTLTQKYSIPAFAEVSIASEKPVGL
jgi:hypothetical protein